MLDKKEKKVLLYLIDNCKGKQVSLIRAEHITIFLSQKYIVSLANLDEIMLSLSKDNYIDFVPTSSKKGLHYCISLKDKALTFKKDMQKQKRAIVGLVLKTVGLAFLSFIIGMILKVIFQR